MLYFSSDIISYVIKLYFSNNFSMNHLSSNRGTELQAVQDANSNDSHATEPIVVAVALDKSPEALATADPAPVVMGATIAEVPVVVVSEVATAAAATKAAASAASIEDFLSQAKPPTSLAVVAAAPAAEKAVAEMPEAVEVVVKVAMNDLKVAEADAGAVQVLSSAGSGTEDDDGPVPLSATTAAAAPKSSAPPVAALLSAAVPVSNTRAMEGGFLQGGTTPQGGGDVFHVVELFSALECQWCVCLKSQSSFESFCVNFYGRQFGITAAW